MEARARWCVVVAVAACHHHEASEHSEGKEHTQVVEADPRTAHGNWYSHEPLCVVDVNADGIGDVVGLANGTEMTAMAVDGRTGLALWTRPMKSGYSVACATDCARVVQSSGADLIISTKTGDFVTTCDTSAFPTDTFERKAREAGYVIGDVTVVVSSSLGNVAEVSAKRGKETLWKKSSGISTFPSVVTALTSDGVLILGTPPGDQGHLAWTLYRATGDEAFRRTEATSSVASVRNAAAFGKRAYFTAVQRVYAIDLDTGNVSWWLGHK